MFAPLVMINPRIPSSPKATTCFFVKARKAFHSNVLLAGREGSFNNRTIGMGIRVMIASARNTASQLVIYDRIPTVAEIRTIPNARPATIIPCTVPSSSFGVVSRANPSVHVSYMAIPVSEKKATTVNRAKEVAGSTNGKISCPDAWISKPRMIYGFRYPSPNKLIRSLSIPRKIFRIKGIRAIAENNPTWVIGISYDRK